MVTDNELKCRIFGMGMVNPKMRYKKKIIEDIPIMITQDNYLLCIPKTQETKHVGATGMTGTCKSLFMNALLGWDYWLSQTSCINLNDFQRETFELSLKTENESFSYSLNKINAKPCPIPLVYVFPSTKTLQIEKKDRRFPLIRMTLPVEEAIRNVENYWKLDKSKVYLGNIKEDLVKCDSIQAIRAVLEESFPEKEQKLMKIKLLNIFEDLFENNMLNVSTPEAPAFLDLNLKYYNQTIQTLMRAGVVPSIQTSDLSNQEYFSAYMSFIVDSIYKNQFYDEYFKDKTVSLFVDEIDKLWLGNRGDLIKRALSLIGTNGRMARIGLRWATQNYEKVTVQIRSNTKYLFVSRKADSKEVNHIKKDFEIPSSMSKDILNLKTDPEKGIFELVALTTERFVLYDLMTGNKSWSSEPKRGTLICPMARHRIPNLPI